MAKNLRTFHGAIFLPVPKSSATSFGDFVEIAIDVVSSFMEILREMLGTGTAAKILWSSFKTYALGGGQGNSLTPSTGIVGRIRNHLRIEASYPARWIRSQGLPMDSNCLTILKWQWC